MSRPRTANLRDGEDEHATPAPNGVDWASGGILPEITSADLAGVDEDPGGVREKRRPVASRAIVEDRDPNDLAEAGWGILYGPSIGEDVRAALEPLLQRRRTQAGPLYSDFPGPKAYRDGESVREWLKRQNVGFAVVNPALGVPLYILIVASPQDIPFDFQYLLDTYWNVGRLYFDDGDPEKYAAYARAVLRYETAEGVPHGKKMAIFATANPGDRATNFFHNQVAKPFAIGSPGVPPVGQKQGFSVDPLLRNEASKRNLIELLAGRREGGRPALLVSGSHGVYADEAVSDRLDKIGAMVTQEWEPGQSLSASTTFSAQDLPEVGRLDGLVHFFFACYSGGCPDFDTYQRRPDGSRKRLLDKTMVGRLPQAMLASGALGVIAHIDRAFACSFQNDRSGPQTQDMHGVLTRIMKGFCLGQALDNFNLRWAILSAELTGLLRTREVDPAAVSDDLLANCWLTRDDARNYLLLGDPAVRLRI